MAGLFALSAKKPGSTACLRFPCRAPLVLVGGCGACSTSCPPGTPTPRLRPPFQRYNVQTFYYPTPADFGEGSTSRPRSPTPVPGAPKGSWGRGGRAGARWAPAEGPRSGGDARGACRLPQTLSSPGVRQLWRYNAAMAYRSKGVALKRLVTSALRRLSVTPSRHLTFSTLQRSALPALQRAIAFGAEPLPRGPRALHSGPPCSGHPSGVSPSTGRGAWLGRCGVSRSAFTTPRRFSVTMLV